jgi:hypothetical protein
MSSNRLTSDFALKLVQHLPRFSSLERVSLSGNIHLGTSGVAAVLSSLIGAMRDQIIHLKDHAI